MRVRQVRVIRNVAVAGAIFGGLLWLVRDYIAMYLDALLVGAACGTAYGAFGVWRLFQRVARRDRRFARNRIFVQFLSVMEIVLLAAASSHYVLIALGIVLLVFALVGILSAHWWTVLVGSLGVAWACTTLAAIIRWERRHGALYYQYDSRAWSGAEGMLYQTGKVVEPLTPSGRVLIDGELWNAVSLSGEHIEAGAIVEVLSLEGLTLHVDRVPVSSGTR